MSRLASSRCKVPARYRQKQREQKRDADLRLFFTLGEGYVSRHIEDPEGSQRWVETGIWEAIA